MLGIKLPFPFLLETSQPLSSSPASCDKADRSWGLGRGRVPMRMPLSAASPPAHLLAGEACGFPVPPREAAAIQRGLLPGSVPAVSPTLRGVHGADSSHHRIGGAAVRGGPAQPPHSPSRGPALALLPLLATPGPRGRWLPPRGCASLHQSVEAQVDSEAGSSRQGFQGSPALLAFLSFEE